MKISSFPTRSPRSAKAHSINDDALRSVVIPDSVDKIDDTAFRGCVNLEAVTISDSVTDFGWGIFNGCDKIHVICSDTSATAKYCDKKNIPYSEK